MTIGRGEAIVVAGSSGSGKSTMLRCINGLETINGGSITIDGQRVDAAGRGLAVLRREIGMVFQSFNLFPHMTVERNVTLAPIKVRGLGTSEARDRAHELLKRVGIPEKAGDYPADLSGGQQQRVAIARALAMDPKLMLFESRRRRWIRKSSAMSSTSCATSPAPGWRWSSSPTRWASRGRSATGWSSAALRTLALRGKLLAEPSGVVALAAVLSGRLDLEGRRVGVLVSGGNADPTLLTRVLAG